MEAWALEHPWLTFFILLAFIYGFKPVNIVLTNASNGKEEHE